MTSSPKISLHSAKPLFKVKAVDDGEHTVECRQCAWQLEVGKLCAEPIPKRGDRHDPGARDASPSTRAV